MVVAFVFYSFAITPAAGMCLLDTSVSDTNGVNYRLHGVNNIKIWISNCGKLYQTMQGQAGCWWPKNTNHNYIFGAGSWFGTIDDATGDTLVTIGYGPHGGETEFASGLSGQDPRDWKNAIYMYPVRWPPPASTFPVAPTKSMSNQDSWCCYNDCDTARHMAGDTRPIGIEVYQTVYAWKYAIVQDALYLILELRNVSGRTLRKLFFGFFTDADIGSGIYDDLFSAIPRRWFRYANGDSALVDDLAYAWQESEEFGWAPSVPGAMGIDLLQTPFDLVLGQDKDSDGIPDERERDSVYYCRNFPQSQWDKDSD